MRKLLIFNLLIWLSGQCPALAQDAEPKVSRYNGKVSQQFVMKPDAHIIDHATGRKITYQQYEQTLKRNPGQYVTLPVFDKFGQASTFELIRKSQLSVQANGAIMNDEDLMPEVGEPLEPFVMTGLDGKRYDSEKLRGKYILLGFWVKYEKPLYTLASTKVISGFIEENRKKGIEIVSLGTTLNSEEECLRAIPKRNCGFVPVPESFGFNHRYKISETPYFILVDRKGIVRAMAPHTEFSRISELILK